MQAYTDEELRELVTQLAMLPRETEWLEFKQNNSDPARIGEYISSLANTAALQNQAFGYLIWGVEDSTHALVGTNFNPATTKYQGQDLEFWLSRESQGEARFTFSQAHVDGYPVVVLTVDAARYRPVEFHGTPFLRVGSHNVRLKQYPDSERRLWDILGNESFETGIAHDKATDDQIFALLDFDVFFDRSGMPRPNSFNEILRIAETNKAIRRRDDGRWQVTNLGALLFAKNLSSFPMVQHRGPRVVQYAGTDRISSLRRQDGVRGYAVGFSALLNWIKALLPASESYVDGRRVEVTVYSDLLLREVIANALMHQDFRTVGSGPLIEIFEDRIEVTNAGIPLLEIDRLINLPPVSRNADLGALMRRMHLSEENGTGWDKITDETEKAGLPAPKVEIVDHATRVTILGPRKLTTMPKSDRVRAVYSHACLRWAANGAHMTNSSLRNRFGISAKNSPQVSRLIADAIEQRQIILFDETVGSRARSYVPYWAINE